MKTSLLELKLIIFILIIPIFSQAQIIEGDLKTKGKNQQHLLIFWKDEKLTGRVLEIGERFIKFKTIDKKVIDIERNRIAKIVVSDAKKQRKKDRRRLVNEFNIKLSAGLNAQLWTSIAPSLKLTQQGLRLFREDTDFEAMSKLSFPRGQFGLEFEYRITNLIGITFEPSFVNSTTNKISFFRETSAYLDRFDPFSPSPTAIYSEAEGDLQLKKNYLNLPVFLKLSFGKKKDLSLKLGWSKNLSLSGEFRINEEQIYYGSLERVSSNLVSSYRITPYPEPKFETFIIDSAVDIQDNTQRNYFKLKNGLILGIEKRQFLSQKSNIELRFETINLDEPIFYLTTFLDRINVTSIIFKYRLF